MKGASFVIIFVLHPSFLTQELLRSWNNKSIFLFGHEMTDGCRPGQLQDEGKSPENEDMLRGLELSAQLRTSTEGRGTGNCLDY